MNRTCWWASGIGWATVGAAVALGVAAWGHGVTADQLGDMVPGAAELPGYNDIEPSGTRRDGMGQLLPDRRMPPILSLGQTPPFGGSISSLTRVLWSDDGAYVLSVGVSVADSAKTAAAAIEHNQKGRSVPFRAGTLTGAAVIGDETRHSPYSQIPRIECRAGRLLVAVHAEPAVGGARGGPRASFPPAVVEALAHAILVRASRLPEATGVAGAPGEVDVHGARLAKGSAVEILGRVYVRPRAVAAALGRPASWDAKTGALSIGGPKPVALAALPGQTTPVKAPLWIDGGEPMMLLRDLVDLLGGQVSCDAQGVYQVSGL